MITEFLIAQFLQSNVLASVALLAALFFIRFLGGRALKRGGFPPLAMRRWTASLRNALIVVAMIGLVMIWAPQLRTFALSLTAFAVASVIAMKELILCISGSALRTLSRAYAVGDYIEIGGRRGEVMDFNLLVTRLRELEGQEGSFHRTGRDIILPHSLLFTLPVRVEGHAGGDVGHAFTMTFEPDANLFAQQAALQQAAIEAYNTATATDAGAPSLTVSVGTSDIGKHRVKVAFHSKPELVSDIERAISRSVGDRVHHLATEAQRAAQVECKFPSQPSYIEASL